MEVENLSSLPVIDVARIAEAVLEGRGTLDLAFGNKGGVALGRAIVRTTALQDGVWRWGISSIGTTIVGCEDDVVA